MAFSTKLAGRTPALLRHGRRLPTALPRRNLTASSLRAPSQLLASNRCPEFLQRRNFSVTAACAKPAAAQEAPNPKAYIESGVIKSQDLVNVKKVLVIGSGGLAIGQAGEFDYSGSSPQRPYPSPIVSSSQVMSHRVKVDLT